MTTKLKEQTYSSIKKVNKKMENPKVLSVKCEKNLMILSKSIGTNNRENKKSSENKSNNNGYSYHDNYMLKERDICTYCNNYDVNNEVDLIGRCLACFGYKHPICTQYYYCIFCPMIFSPNGTIKKKWLCEDCWWHCSKCYRAVCVDHLYNTICNECHIHKQSSEKHMNQILDIISINLTYIK